MGLDMLRIFDVSDDKPPEEAPSEGLLVQGGQVIDGTGASPQHQTSIWIENGRIAALGSEADALAAERPHRRLEADGLTVLPGLIDAHVHLVWDNKPHPLGVRQMVTEWARMTDIELVLRATRFLRQTLAAGVTTVRDCGDRHNCILPVRDALADGTLAGPRVLASGMPITTTAGHCHYLGLTADSVDEVRKAVRGQVQAGVDFIKIMLTGGGITPGSNPLQLQYSLPEAQVVATEAHRLGKKVAAHIHAAAGMNLAVTVGVDTLEHSNWLTPPEGGDGYDPAVVERMAKAGLAASITMAGQDFALLQPEDQYTPEMRTWRKAREHRFRWVRSMIEAGVPLLICTDAGGAVNTPHGSLPLAAQVFVELVGMTPMDVIVAITRTPAEALGLAGEIGTIEVGKRADLLLVAGNPSEDITTLREVRWVMQDGKIVVDHGCLVEEESM